ncbi:MAG TPA: DMT family transporter [Actinospica sp.]|nr:DMT family transporter [Actinospica sp.]
MAVEVESSRPALHTHRTELVRGILPILVCSVLWGAVGLVSTYIPSGASPEAVGSAGLIVTGLAMLIARPGARALVRRARGRDRLLQVIGSFGLLAYPLAFFPAVQRLGVALATAITLGSAPLFAGLISRFVERRRLTKRWLQCAPIAVAGTVLMVTGDAGAHSVSVVGVILALIPGLAYATASTVAARLIGKGYASGDVYGGMFGTCALWAVPVLVASGGLHGIVSVRGAVVVLFYGCVTNYLCYTLFGRALRYTTAATATTVTLAEGAVGTLLGVFAHGERLAPAAWGGLGLLAAALVLLSLPGGRTAGRAAGRTVRRAGRTARTDR